MADQVSAVIAPERSIGEKVRHAKCTGRGRGGGHSRYVCAVIVPEQRIGEKVRPVKCTRRGGGEGHGRASKCRDIAGA